MVSARGNTPRGPERWQRAALNAIKRPNSVAASLYFGRVEKAHQIAAASEAPLQPWAHVGKRYTYDYKTRSATYKIRREYATCSVFCAVMQAQLDCGSTLPEIAAAFDRKINATYESTWSAIQKLDPSTLTRKVRCQVCGGNVR